jgi:hypothetical protein
MAGSWQTCPQGGGEYLVIAPDGTEYQVTAHYKYTSSPIPEDDVHIDQITSGGRLLFAGGRLLVKSLDAEVTMAVENAVLKAEGY